MERRMRAMISNNTNKNNNNNNTIKKCLIIRWIQLLK